MVKTYNTMMDLFNDPFLIGFTREFERLNSIQKTNSTVSYPPYNVVKIDEDNYRLDLAVAGFSKKDVPNHPPDFRRNTMPTATP